MISALFLGLAVAASAGPPTESDTLPRLPVYTAVIEHARQWYPSRPQAPVALGESQYVNCGSDCRGELAAAHEPAVLETLRRAGVVQRVCRPLPGQLGCGVDEGHVYIGVGPLQPLPADTRVAPIRHEDPGVNFVEQFASMPDTLRVPAGVAVDVVVYGPCAPDEACRFPNLVIFRYFLRQGCTGEYEVVARYPTGGT